MSSQPILRVLRYLTLVVMFCVASGLWNRAQAQMFGIAGLLNPEGSRLFPQLILYPRHPGKPDPRWKTFEWRYIDRMADSTKYRLYFYDQEDWTARFAMPRIKTQVEDLSRFFNYSPSKPFSYLLFTSQREFRQANVFFVTEGVQGITSTEEATMAIPYWGEAQTFDHISKHEMTHQFQVQKIQDASGRYSAERMQLIPLWFIEGMAEYYSLNGVDAESRVYLRDLVLHPNKDHDYTPPKLFEEGAMGFVHTYKVGQAKIDFLEKRFGMGTVQKLLEAAAKEVGPGNKLFPNIAAQHLGQSVEELERGWNAYLDGYKREADTLPQGVEAFESLKDVGDTLDYFDVSPDGKLLATREVDPLTGRTSIQLANLEKDPGRKILVAQDNQPGLLSLYFMQWPTVTLTNDWIAYAVDTITGPEIEVRRIRRDGDSADLDAPIRLKLEKLGFLQTTSLAFSPDGKNLAMVGLTNKGWGNVYIIPDFPAGFPSQGQFVPKALTNEHYSWRSLSWDSQGILAATDRTPNGKYGLVRLNPETGAITLLARGTENFLSPASGPDGGILYQSWVNGQDGHAGSPQVHLLEKKGSDAYTDRKLTGVKTGFFYPRYREGKVYALAFHAGRYQLYRFGDKSFLNLPSRPLAPPAGGDTPWPAQIDPTPEGIQAYKPFSSSGIRIENLVGFLTTGSYGGIAGTLSDLMRNYSITGEFAVLGGLSRTSASAFFSSQQGRSTWTVGAYHTIQPRLDNIYEPNDGLIRTYLHREYGALGAIQYPFGAFSYLDLELRLAGVRRSDFSDPSLIPAWDAQNPGGEFMVAPVARIGYDGVLYEAFSGPLQGLGVLFEGDTSYFPSRKAFSERLRLDVAQYWRLTGTTVLAVQGMSAATFGDRFKSSFLVSSDDIMRAYPFDDDRLYGNYLLAAKAELRFPIGTLFKFPPLRGLLSYDVGSIFVRSDQISSRIASSYTGGISFNLPPIALNLMLSKPLRTAPAPAGFRDDSTVFHFTLRYLYM